MTLSGITAFSAIPERSEATPGLFNSRLQQLQDNVVSLYSNVSTFLNTPLSTNTIQPESGQTVRVLNGKHLVARSYDSGGAVFNARAFGAVGDGATDDSAAIQKAINAGGAGSYILIPPSAAGYLLNSAVTAAYDDQVIDFRGTTLYVSHSTVALTIGVPNANTKRPKVLGGYIKHTSNYNWVAGSIGFRALNTQWGHFDLSVNGLYQGVELLSDGAGTASEMNFTKIGVLSNALFGVRLYGQSGGYCNDNTFDGGEIRFDSGVPTSSSTGYCIVVDRAVTGTGTSNNNKFRGIALQSSITVAARLPRAIYLNGQQIHFSELRGEGGFQALSIVLGSDATLGTNYFRQMGPGFTDRATNIDYTSASGASVLWVGNSTNEFSKRVWIGSNLSVDGTGSFSSVSITNTGTAVPLLVRGDNAAASGQVRIESVTGAIPRVTLYEDTTFRLGLQASSTGVVFDAQNNQPWTFGGTGTASFGGEVDAASGFSALASIASVSRVSSSKSVIAGGLWGSGLSIGGGGTLIPAISSVSSKVGAFVVQGSASSFTVVTWAAVQPGDLIQTTVSPDAAASSMSSGLVAHSHCTQVGQFEFRLSNVSTLVQNQSSKTWFFLRTSPF